VSSSLDALIERTLVEEGGFVDRPDDRGGPTKYGQTIPWLTDLLGRPVTADEVRALSREEAGKHYRTFAERWGFDKVLEAAPHCGYVLFDFAVNSGRINTIRALQRALDVAPDGVIGSRTVNRMREVDDTSVALEVLATRLELFGRLARKQAQFVEGWLNRVARQLRDLW
jgi:lysozyme family protein